MERPRILVVDDQAEILELTALVLSRAGYEVATAGTGIDALDHVATRRFDLVLLDINMPGMDGWETLRLIRADEDSADLPVVMFSVKNQMRDRVFALQEGALDYITKPFEVDQLLFRVRRVLEARRGGVPRVPAPRPEV